ncbi:MAG: IPT/TIG domain-containing protein [Myxococcota bacterium]|nr:IPT/TIG domain-containing protein [Myxococcota bacterium]
MRLHLSLPATALLLSPVTGCVVGLSPLTDTAAAPDPDFAGWGGGTGEASDADDADDDGNSGTDGEPDSDEPNPGEDDQGGGPSDDGTADDADTPIESDRITAIEPQHGSTLGGTRLVIFGGPFDAGTEVEVAGVRVGIIENTGDTLRVATPSSDAEGWASVTAIAPDGTRSEWTEGFYFWQDGTGLAGATGYYEWIQPVGDYWTGGPPDAWGGALVTYLVPHDFYWWHFVTTSPGTCVSTGSLGYTGELFAYDMGATALRLDNAYGGSTSLPYAADSNGFRNDSLTAADFIASHAYTAQPLEGADSPDDSIAGFITTPAPFNVTNPDIDASLVPYIGRTQTITWEAGGADVVWIEMARVDALGTGIDEGIICIASDTGSFTVPSSAWASWPSGRQVNLFVSKSIDAHATLPHNNSEVRVSSKYTIYGAGFSL